MSVDLEQEYFDENQELKAEIKRLQKLLVYLREEMADILKMLRER